MLLPVVLREVVMVWMLLYYSSVSVAVYGLSVSGGLCCCSGFQVCFGMAYTETNRGFRLKYSAPCCACCSFTSDRNFSRMLNCRSYDWLNPVDFKESSEATW